METNKQWKRVPFDIELAKKIQAREIEGKIKTCKGASVRIASWDMKCRDNAPILALVDCGYEEEAIAVDVYGKEKVGPAESMFDLVLEVPDNEPQFKPFDMVLVRNRDGECWHPSLYATTDGLLYYTIDCKNWQQCIPYEGNQELVGTTNKPKEE